MGHLTQAAGVAGLIKATLALYHRQIPPSINFSTPNPAIDFVNSPFFVNTRTNRLANSEQRLTTHRSTGPVRAGQG